MKDSTTIQVSIEVWQILKALRKTPSDDFDIVLRRELHEHMSEGKKKSG